MNLFLDENELEELEYPPQSLSSPLLENIRKLGEEKTEAPLHRTRRLRGWPSETTKKELFQNTYLQEHGMPGNKDSIAEWKTKKSEEFWAEITDKIEEAEKNRILKEYALTHISQIICNTIRLENLYTTLPPLGENQWKNSPPALKNLTQSEALANITENPELLKKEPSDWVKGTILYLSLQNKPLHQTTPMPAHLKTAALWCLNPHLSILGEQKDIESTQKVFHNWKSHRKKIRLQVEKISLQDIPEEVRVPPIVQEDLEIPWILGWKILPILEKEIREVGEKIIENPTHLYQLGQIYKKRLYDRWISNSLRRAYLRKYEESLSVAERWRAKTLIYTPINNYIPTKIQAPNNHLRLLSKTEAVWMMQTEKLPEPTEQTG